MADKKFSKIPLILTDKTVGQKPLMKTDKKLVEIPYQEWPELRELYRFRKLKSVTFNMIQNYITWKRDDPVFDYVKFYALDGDWSDGTFIIQDDYIILFDTLDRKDGSGAERLLESLCLLNYSELRLLNGYDSRLQPVVDKLIERLNLDSNYNLNGSYDLYILPQAKAAILPEKFISHELTFTHLSESDAEQVDESWSFRHEGSLSATERLIRHGKSLGVYTVENELVGYIIVQQIGTMGFLKVHSHYSMFGLANALVERMSKLIASEGQDVMTLVPPNNPISEGLFRGFGFRKLLENTLTWTFVIQPRPLKEI